MIHTCFEFYCSMLVFIVTPNIIFIFFMIIIFQKYAFLYSTPQAAEQMPTTAPVRPRCVKTCLSAGMN